MKSTLVGLALGCLAPALQAQSAPPELAALMQSGRITGELRAWCRAEFQQGAPGGFAVALRAAVGARYAAVFADGRAIDLAAFTGSADLSCYSALEARRLDESIRTSATVEGRVTPRWETTVVCGFIDDTTAECWQYDPSDPSSRVFARVGGWTT